MAWGTHQRARQRDGREQREFLVAPDAQQGLALVAADQDTEHADAELDDLAIGRAADQEQRELVEAIGVELAVADQLREHVVEHPEHRRTREQARQVLEVSRRRLSEQVTDRLDDLLGAQALVLDLRVPTHDAVERPGGPAKSAALMLLVVRQRQVVGQLMLCTLGVSRLIVLHSLNVVVDRWPSVPHAGRIEIVQGPVLSF
jgi:hypothetical protein